MDYLNMKVADVTSKWVRQNFDVDAEQKMVTRTVETVFYLFEMSFHMPLDEFIGKLNGTDAVTREQHACLRRLKKEDITTKIKHEVYNDYGWDDSREERHSFAMTFEYQEPETKQETVERLAEEVRKAIRNAKAKAKAAAQKATLKQKKAELKKLELQNEFELYQKLKKKFEE